ncbi:cupin domain protein [Medicago truncatula]|uniref:Cupin domain protein n=1 Tax=Medicago truncatula TaxID=3880 RepID=A0A072V622_MEDTR|nr:cupin domain protein [Medicago truncatula]
MTHIDIAPWGVNPPHSHPRATEILTVLEGTLEVGFITSNPENRHFRLIHYQRNIGYNNVVANLPLLLLVARIQELSLLAMKCLGLHFCSLPRWFRSFPK